MKSNSYSLVSDSKVVSLDVVFYYKDVFVEVHYFPTYLNRFSKNKILQHYIDENKTRQFTHYVRVDDKYELCVPTDDFNVVYQICHLFNHFFCTGIGLRHFIDYYLLKKVGCFEEVRENAIKQFQELGMDRFAKGVMWIEKEVLGLGNEYLLMTGDEKTGKLIQKEILKYGNFNKADLEGRSVINSKLSNTFRPFKYLFQFTKESIDRILFLGRLHLQKLRLFIN